jgi:hypothetical protein
MVLAELVADQLLVQHRAIPAVDVHVHAAQVQACEARGARRQLRPAPLSVAYVPHQATAQRQA